MKRLARITPKTPGGAGGYLALGNSALVHLSAQKIRAVGMIPTALSR